MEQERKSRLGSSVDIRPEVLRYRGSAAQPPERRPYLQVALALCLVAAGTGAGIYLKGGRSAAEPRTAALAQQAESASQPQTAPSPSVAPIAQQQALPQPAPVPAPAVQPMAAPATTAAAVAAPARSASKAPPAPSYTALPPAERAPSAMSRPAKPPRAVEVPQAARVDAPAPADINVSGIAWQDERTLRRAVVNGVLVGEGAQVAGAKVVEIRENRVRFSRAGQSFDVPYTTN